MGSTWGEYLKISVYGESHGKAIGVTIDGFPPGIAVDMDSILTEMARRAPGKSDLTTKRSEKDMPILLSGVLNGQTTGTPICVMIENTDMRSGDYIKLEDVPRPGHSDYTGRVRYRGQNDLRGGGHFSGRLTAPLVFAGALCKLFLREKKGVEIGSHLLKIGSVRDDVFDMVGVSAPILRTLQKMRLPVLDEEAASLMEKTVMDAMARKDSVGGVIQCGIVGAEAGLGSPMFGNVESRIASLLYGIPAVKGVAFGEGFELCEKMGSDANDGFEWADGRVVTRTNHSGGILGGITTGMPIVFDVAIKPTPSIAATQRTLNVAKGNQEELRIQGRHDPCIALRAPVVVEAVAAIAMLDFYREAYGYDA